MRNPAYARVMFLVIVAAIASAAVAGSRGWGIESRRQRDPWGSGVRLVKELPSDGGVWATVEQDGLLCTLEMTRTVFLVGEPVTTRLIMRNVSDRARSLGEIDMGWIVPDSATARGYMHGFGGGYRSPEAPPVPRVTLAPGEETSTIVSQTHFKPAEYSIQGAWAATVHAFRARTDSVRVRVLTAEEFAASTGER